MDHYDLPHPEPSTPYRTRPAWDALPAVQDPPATVLHPAGTQNVLIPAEHPRGTVLVPTGNNTFVALPAANLPAGYLHTLQPAAPQHTVQPIPQPTGPLIDRRAQVLAAGGIAAAGTGWGISQILTSLAGLSGGSLLALAVLLIAWRMSASRSHTGDTYNITNTTTNNNRWFGKSTSHNG
jgi:hypothetical protein